MREKYDLVRRTAEEHGRDPDDVRLNCCLPVEITDAEVEQEPDLLRGTAEQVGAALEGFRDIGVEHIGLQFLVGRYPERVEQMRKLSQAVIGPGPAVAGGDPSMPGLLRRHLGGDLDPERVAAEERPGLGVVVRHDHAGPDVAVHALERRAAEEAGAADDLQREVDDADRVVAGDVLREHGPGHPLLHRELLEQVAGDHLVRVAPEHRAGGLEQDLHLRERGLHGGVALAAARLATCSRAYAIAPPAIPR